MTPKDRRDWPTVGLLFDRIQRRDFPADMPYVADIDARQLATELATLVGMASDEFREAMRRPPAPLIITVSPERFAELSADALPPKDKP